MIGVPVRVNRDASDRPDLLVRGGKVANLHTRRVETKDIWISNGVIVAIGDDLGEDVAKSRVIDASSCIVVPGFVNGHTHSYGTLCRQVGLGLPLEPWMMHAWAYTSKRTPDEIYMSALLQAIEAAHTGTTAFLDHLGGHPATAEAALAAYEAVGLRVTLAPMISDVPLPDTVAVAREEWSAGSCANAVELMPGEADASIDATLELHEKWNGRLGRIEIALGPSAPQRCTPKLLRRCAELSAERGIRVHTHLLETRAQVLMKPYANCRTWSTYLSSIGLLSERLSIAHAIWLTADEIELIAESGATLIHNPQSNLQLGSGIADVGAWRQAGAHIGIGTDGANCGGSMDMLSSIRLAAILHRPSHADPREWESAWSALSLGTEGGSFALGIKSSTLSVGAPADLALFELRGTAFASGEDPLSTLVLSAYNHEAHTTIVDGAVVLHRGVMETVDEEDLLKEAANAHRSIRSRNEPLAAIARAQEEVLLRHSASAPALREIVPFHATEDA